MKLKPRLPEPCAHVHPEALFWFLAFQMFQHECWWDGCCAIENAFITAGWSPPADYVPAAWVRDVPLNLGDPVL